MTSLLGISGASGNFFAKTWNVLQHLPDVSVGLVLTGILCLTAMLLFRYMAPDIPAALVVMAIATILIGLLGGEATGVQVAGHIPSGLPHLTSPNLDPTILYELAPGALAIVLIGYAEALGAAKAATIQSGGDINPNQELVAHGPANILSGLFGGFLVVGSLSKTSVAIAAGARSQATYRSPRYLQWQHWCRRQAHPLISDPTARAIGVRPQHVGVMGTRKGLRRSNVEICFSNDRPQDCSRRRVCLRCVTGEWGIRSKTLIDISQRQSGMRNHQNIGRLQTGCRSDLQNRRLGIGLRRRHGHPDQHDSLACVSRWRVVHAR
jgi:hypothetical protein